MVQPSGTVPGGGLVDTVNGVAPVGGDVTLVAADIPFTATYLGTKADSVTDVDGMLVHLHTNAGTSSRVWSLETLGLAAPLAGSSYQLTTPTSWTAPLDGSPIDLPPGRDIATTNPGSIDALGGVKVLIRGDVAGPLLHGEILANGVAILNQDFVAGSDIDMSSPSGRFIALTQVTLLGNAGVIRNMPGGASLQNLVMTPSAPGLKGLRIDETIGSLFITASAASAPGGSAHTAYEVPSTATVLNQLVWSVWSYSSALAADNFVDIDVAATLPNTPDPTTEIGVRIFGGNNSGPGATFAPGGLDQTSIKISSSSNLNAPSSRYFGDGVVDTLTDPDILVPTSGVAAGVAVVVPITNASGGGAGPTLRTLTLTSASERYTLIRATTGVAWAPGDPDTDWALRYNGAPGDVEGGARFDVEIKRAGSGQNVTLSFEHRPIGGGAWTLLPETSSTPKLTLTATQDVSGSAPRPSIQSGDEIRLVGSSAEGSSDFLVPRFRVIESGQT